MKFTSELIKICLLLVARKLESDLAWPDLPAQRWVEHLNLPPYFSERA